MSGCWAAKLARNLHWWYSLLPGMVLALSSGSTRKLGWEWGMGVHGGRQVLLRALVADSANNMVNSHSASHGASD